MLAQRFVQVCFPHGVVCSGIMMHILTQHVTLYQALSKHFMYIYSSHQPYEVSTTIMPILQMGKLRHREVP